MIEYIRRYFFARAVCKKKGIKFKPWFCGNIAYRNFKIKRSSIITTFSDDGKISNTTIKVDIFQERFYSVLAHELGHYIDNKVRCKTTFSGKIIYEYNSNHPLKIFGPLSEYGETLLMEMQASKNARRLLKKWNKNSVENIRDLSWAFSQYVSRLPQEEKADIMYIGQRYIGSDQ